MYLKQQWNLKQMSLHESNALWNYVVVNASLRSYIIRHDQSGLSRPNHKGKKEDKMNIHNVVNSKMTEFNQRGCVLGSNALWVYMVVNSSWRAYIIY